MTGQHRQRIPDTPVLQNACGRQTVNYFQALFSAPDTDLYGWSPLNVYSSGVELLRQNNPLTEIYFIERGVVKISCTGPTKDIALSVELNRFLSREIQGDLEKITTLACLSAPERLRSFFHELLTEEEFDELWRKDSLVPAVVCPTTLHCSNLPQETAGRPA